MKLMPASRALATIRVDVASSVGPPNIMVPRQIGEIFRPLRPSGRYCMDGSSGCHSGMVRKDQTTDVQLHIGESRDSGFDASHRPGMTKGGLLRGACHRARIRATRWLAMTAGAMDHSSIS